MSELLDLIEKTGFEKSTATVPKKKQAKKKSVKKEPVKKKPLKKKTPVEKLDPDLLPVGIGDFEDTTGLPSKVMDLTIEQLIRKHGSLPGLKDWAEVLAKLKRSEKMDLEIAQRRNQLIEKDFVTANDFKYLNLFMKSIFDLANSQTTQIINLVQSDIEKARVEIPKLRIAAYSKSAKRAKKQIKSSYDRLRKKYEQKEETDIDE